MEGKAPLAPRSNGTELAKRQTFFFHRNKNCIYFSILEWWA